MSCVKISHQPRPWQERALTFVEDHLRTSPSGGATIEADCGLGKTFFAIALAARMGVRTIVLVHTSVLLEQWKERVRTFLPECTIGVIQGKRHEDGDIVIATLQTILNHTAKDFKSHGFGLTICDECHHICAKTFNQALLRLPTRYIVGLSATLERRDGNGHAIFWLLGPLLVSAKRINEPLQVRFLRLPWVGDPPITDRYGEILYSSTLSQLLANKDRRAHIEDELRRLYNEGRHVLVIIGSRDFAMDLAASCQEWTTTPEEVLLFIGESSKKRKRERESQLEEGVVRIILATPQMAAEGFDHPIIDTTFLATPMSTKGGRLEQAIGRCQRSCTEKVKCNQIVDIHDNYCMFQHMGFARMHWYRERGYKINVRTIEAVSPAEASPAEASSMDTPTDTPMAELRELDSIREVAVDLEPRIVL